MRVLSCPGLLFPAPLGLHVARAVAAEQGVFVPALTNMVRAATPLVNAIARHWPAWRDGVPEGR